LLEILKSTLESGEEVKISGFRKVEVKKMQERTAGTLTGE